jgi:tetratricopeptide (TPR) repeat protein
LDEFKPNPWQKRFFVLNNLGTLFLDQGDYKRADLHLQAAMEIMKTQELTPASVGACVNNIGLMKKLQGNFVEAYSLYKTAHKALEADQSPDKSLIMLSFNNLANLCIEVNKLNEAAEYLDAFDRLVDETVGRNHAVFSRALHSRSKLLTKQLKYNQAEQTCHDAVALSERTFGASHPYTASCYNTLGSIQLKRLQLRQAETSIKRAIAIFDESYAVKNHPRTAEALTNLGDVYFVGEQVQQARDAYRNALQMLHALCTDPQHPQRLLVQRKLNLSLNEGN